MLFLLQFLNLSFRHKYTHVHIYIYILNDWCSLHIETAHNHFIVHCVSFCFYLFLERFSYWWWWCCCCYCCCCVCTTFFGWFYEKKEVGLGASENAKRAIVGIHVFLYVYPNIIIPYILWMWNAKDQCEYIFGGNCRHHLCNERFMISNINAQAHPRLFR